MHIFISDLHMTDTGVGGAVTDERLSRFAHGLEGLAQKSENKLILVGDIFDLLRSPKWAELWKENKRAAPWSGSSPKFKHFKKSFAEPCAIGIAESIAKRYSTFSKSLKRLVEGGWDVIYVPGNHDYMFQLSSDLRTVLIDFLGLKHDASKEFQISYTDRGVSVFAIHGNSFDPVNWHRRNEGYWALGDAVVLRIVNRFPVEVCQRVGVPLDGELGTALQDIDNIEPLSDIPLWVLWASEANLSIHSSRVEVLQVWKEVVDDFLRLKEFQDKKAFGAAEYQRLRYAFEFSTKMRLADLISSLAQQFRGVGTNYRAVAEAEARKYEHYRFVLFGHTHKPRLDPLRYIYEEKNTFYVNTGCWRRLVARIPDSDPVSFAARRVGTYFVVDDEGVNDERYHLFQEWNVI